MVDYLFLGTSMDSIWLPPLAGLMEGIKLIVSAIMLIVLLYAAAALLFGGQLGISSPFQFNEHQRHSLPVWV